MENGGSARNIVSFACAEGGQGSMEKMRTTENIRWEGAYRVLDDVHVYNPKAVVSTMLRGKLQSYWSQTGTYVSIMPLINMNFDGLKDAIISMIAGKSVPVEIYLGMQRPEKTIGFSMCNLLFLGFDVKIITKLGCYAY